ncbi:MAG: manganese efflux pump [Bacilli bacterium]|nr:manganese efflux pump [Bacilli bacterium]
MIIVEVILLGIALSMDAFAVSVSCGLTYVDLNKKKCFFIAFVFGLMQALMPLIGYWIVELITILVDEASGAAVGQIASTIVSCIAFSLLIFLGIKMIIEAVKEMKKSEEEKEPKKYSFKEVMYFGIATSIDALGAGVALHAGLSNNVSIWLHVTIIMVCTFTISLIGIILAKQVTKLLKGKFEITGIIGGCILILLGIWILLSHFLGL